mgnify:CR=1 FL=1
MDLLSNYKWPGNVRELINVLEYTVSFLEDDIIKVDNLPPNIKKTNEMISEGKTLKELLSDYEKKIIHYHLRKHGDNLESKKTVANVLNISLSSLYNKIGENTSKNIK